MGGLSTPIYTYLHQPVCIRCEQSSQGENVENRCEFTLGWVALSTWPRVDRGFLLIFFALEVCRREGAERSEREARHWRRAEACRLTFFRERACNSADMEADEVMDTVDVPRLRP